MLYRRLPSATQAPPATGGLRLSVLIPARNEEENIELALQSILSNDYPHFEVIVMDDHSTDRTKAIVERTMKVDPRVRLVEAPPLPEGWCGKQHACFQLARYSKGDLLLFVDADVRLSSDALARTVHFMDNNKAALASGVPKQEFSGFTDRLLIPQIHFVLLGYLPLWAMRKSKMPALSGGCGQLMVAQRMAYMQCGGHSRIPATLHDGLKLPRVFRQAGYPTELFDATDIASCRMYSSDQETIAGLGKNAHEGLGAKETILPMTCLLLLGQVAPIINLGVALAQGSSIFISFLAVLAMYLPRMISIERFRQPAWSAMLHPISVLALLTIQWSAFLRHRRGKPSTWKGRAYAGAK